MMVFSYIIQEINMTNHGHDQSIGGDSDSPIDGIRGTHAGGIEPAGQDVNAGKPKPGKRQDSDPGARQSIAQGDQLKGSDLPSGETGTVGTQGPGGAQQGGKIKP